MCLLGSLVSVVDVGSLSVYIFELINHGIFVNKDEIYPVLLKIFVLILKTFLYETSC